MIRSRADGSDGSRVVRGWVECSVLLAFLVTGWRAGAATADVKETIESPADVRKLQEARVEVLRQMEAEAVRRRDMGLGVPGEIEEAARLLAEAELELAQTPEQRRAVLERILAQARAQEEQAVRREQAGVGPRYASLQAKAHRLKAEIELARSKGGATGARAGAQRGPAADEARRKARENARAAQDALEALRRREAAGEPLTIEFIERLIDAHRRLAESELAVAETPDQRAETARRYVNDVRRLVEVVEARLDQDADAVTVAAAKHELAEAELLAAKVTRPEVGAAPAAAAKDAVTAKALERVNAARAVVAAMERRETAGVAPHTSAHAKRKLAAQRKLAEALLAVAATPEERLAAAEAYHAQARRHLKQTKARRERDASDVDVAEAQRELADAEAWLAEVKAGR